jgi:hypothetical protein
LSITPKPTALDLAILSPAPNLNIQATLTAAGQPLTERSVFFVLADDAGVVHHAAPIITDFLGQARLGAIPIPPATYDVHAYFNGAIPLDGSVGAPTLQTVILDPRYAPISDSDTFTYVAQPATVTYTGQTVVVTDGTIHLEAQVTAPTPNPDLTLAVVEFTVRNSAGVEVESVTAPVASDGVSVAAIDGLPPGTYTIDVQVIGGSFNSPLVSTPVGVGAANTLTQLIQYTIGLGLSAGTQSSLLNKLENASGSISNGSLKVACNALKAFINEVASQRGKKVPTAEADQLTSKAQQIRNVLQCE